MVQSLHLNHGNSGKLWGTFYQGNDVIWCLPEKDHGGYCVAGGQMPHCPALSSTLLLPSSDRQEPAITPHKWLLPANKMDQLMVESFVCLSQWSKLDMKIQHFHPQYFWSAGYFCCWSFCVYSNILVMSAGLLPHSPPLTIGFLQPLENSSFSRRLSWGNTIDLSLSEVKKSPDWICL